jgi:hypothetical protein
MTFKVRFHLGRGDNYQNWQISRYPEVLYLNPFESNLILKDCTLKNNKKIAEKIYNGENKSVCSWILCKETDLVLNSNFDKKLYKRIFYNPRKAPYWTDIDGNDLDGYQCQIVRSVGKDLYCI